MTIIKSVYNAENGVTRLWSENSFELPITSGVKQECSLSPLNFTELLSKNIEVFKWDQYMSKLWSMPVSYTHLDVYKRQVWKYAAIVL